MEYKNAEEYADPTAYLAIKRIGDTDMEFKRGEIFEYEMSNGDTKNVLVVSADYRSANRILSIIAMNSSPTNEDSVAVATVRGLLYADPWMVGFAQNHRFQEYVCACSAEAMAAVDEGIAEALGLTMQETIVVKEDGKDAAIKEIDALKKDLAAAEQRAAKADTYKELYEQLLEKLIER